MSTPGSIIDRKGTVSPPPRHIGIRSTCRSRALVGIVGNSYGYERVSYGLRPPGHDFVTLWRLPLHRLARQGSFWWQTPIVLDASVGVVHTWNMVPIGRQKFIVSFENELPRHLGEARGWHAKTVDAVLESDRCRGLYALSETAAELARSRFSRRGLFAAASKVDVFRGGVSRLADGRQREYDGSLRCLFVGGNGFAKGLVPTLRCADRLRRAGVELSMTVVTSFRGHKYVLRDCTPDESMWRQFIAERRWIAHFEALPNAAVQELMCQHDILLLPSYDETLGWVVIEAGLMGLPSVVTNVFALPELVEHGKTGIVLDLALDAERRWVGLHLEGQALRDAIRNAEATVENGLVAALTALSVDGARLVRMGAAAESRMRTLHDPKVASERLCEIYANALAA